MEQWEIPQGGATLLRRLEAAGAEAYFVGGCVRDHLLGIPPKDWDVTTSALPETVRQIFGEAAVLDTGLRHGTVTVRLEDFSAEVTTFRRDGPYADHRRPVQVAFSGSLREDLARRDFTVNAMAYHPTRGLTDPFGGQADLAAHCLRAVGDPAARFEEDALRILRLARFSAVLGFAPEARTLEAALRQRALLEYVAPERLLQELDKLLTGAYAAEALRLFTPVILQVLPELAPSVGFDQNNKHHPYDVWEHTLHALAACPAERILRWTLLLHDSGKPLCYTVDFRGDGHFYGHAARSEALARQALDRLRMEHTARDRICCLIARHDNDLLATPPSLRRWLNQIGADALRQLLAVKRADNRGQHPRYDRGAEYDHIEERLEALLAETPCFTRAQLAVRGGDLLALGLSGSAVGDGIDWLLEQVLAGVCENQREALLAHFQAHR